MRTGHRIPVWRKNQVLKRLSDLEPKQETPDDWKPIPKRQTDALKKPINRL